MPLSKGEVVGIALIRDLMEDQATDLGILRDQLFNDTDDEDSNDVSMAAFYAALATDFMDKILTRHDRPKEPSKELVLYDSKKDKDLSEAPTGAKPPKKLTEMTPKEIGEGTVLFDPDGEAWVAELWTDSVLDLKQGNVKKANVRPKDLEGWSFEGVTFDDRITRSVEELMDSMESPSAGLIAAEIIKQERSLHQPLQIIKQVNRVLDAA